LPGNQPSQVATGTEILREAGFSDHEIEALVAEGALLENFKRHEV
jgi:hypothetical protein